MLLRAAGYYHIGMDREKIARYLEELKSEISSLEDRDTGTASRLKDLTGRIEAAVDSASDDSGNRDILDNLQRAIENLETEHPAVTSVLNRLATTLGNMGI